MRIIINKISRYFCINPNQAGIKKLAQAGGCVEPAPCLLGFPLFELNQILCEQTPPYEKSICEVSSVLVEN